MKKYSEKRILVTDGAGFLGSHLCERLLNEGHEVLCDFLPLPQDNPLQRQPDYFRFRAII